MDCASHEQTVKPPPLVTGLSLSGSSPVEISARENRALCESMGVIPEPGGRAHPAYYYIVTQVGMGVSVAQLCAACGFDVADAPMMATSSARFFRSLMTGQPYIVRGEVVGLTRKTSRKLGLMDLLEYQLCLDLPNGDKVLETNNVWVLPRGRYQG